MGQLRQRLTYYWECVCDLPRHGAATEYYRTTQHSPASKPVSHPTNQPSIYPTRQPTSWSCWVIKQAAQLPAQPAQKLKHSFENYHGREEHRQSVAECGIVYRAAPTSLTDTLIWTDSQMDGQMLAERHDNVCKNNIDSFAAHAMDTGSWKFLKGWDCKRANPYTNKYMYLFCI